jgi:predicted RNA binding protein YcfA (HicA-like mRNA interferase family)
MPQDRRLSEVTRQLESHGWAYVRDSQNAHAVFEKVGHDLLVIPHHKKKVRACYEKRIKKACEENKQRPE